MKTVLSFTVGLSLLMTPMSITSHSAWADSNSNPPPAEACTVPVCDIPAKLNELRNGSQAFRYQTVNQLRTGNKKNLDLKAQQNLREFAVAVRQVFNDLQEEDYLIREAEYLLDQALMILTQYSPISANTMFENFRLMSSEGNKLDVLRFWQAKVTTLTNMIELQELTSFAKQVLTLSEISESVSTFANNIISAVTGRVSFLDPFHEGLYEAHLTCETNFEKKLCDRLKGESFSMNILNAVGSAEGLIVSIVSQGSGELFTYIKDAKFNLDELSIEGETPENFQPAGRFRVVINRTTKEVTGWLRNTRLPENIMISGKLVRSPSEFSHDAGPPELLTRKQVEGTYEGMMGEKEGTLIVKEISNKRFAASFYSKDEFKLVREFTFGDFVKEKGLLTLMSRSGNDYIKLILAYRKDAQTAVSGWTGFSYSTGDSKSLDLMFHRIGDVVDVPVTPQPRN